MGYGGAMRSSLPVLGGIASALLLCAAQPLLAQRASDNVTTQSGDAFGRAVGSEKSGLYTSDDVRGFDPVEAGNVRLEGLYFDQVEKVSTRLVDGSTIRVGPATLHYPFPAPTGLVDYSLTQPHDRTSYSAQLDTGSSTTRGIGGNIEIKQPFGDGRWGLSGGVGFRNIHRIEGGTGRARTFGATLAFRPAPGTEVLAFGGDFLFRSDEARPTLFLAPTAAAPPRLTRGTDLGQSWTGKSNDTWLWGLIAKLPLGEGLRLESGTFYTRKDSHRSYADLLTGVTAEGLASGHKIVADAGARDASLSGELRLVREWRGGGAAHRLVASLRGRDRTRRFGGAQAFQLGPLELADGDYRAEPAYALGPKNRDRVEQATLGLSYGLIAAHGLTFDASLARSRYRKRIDLADPALAPVRSADDPLLWNVALAQRLGAGVQVYGGITQGQEEAQIAPDVAVNRAEAPPAIHTRQIEAGVRLGLNPHLTLIAGAFAITKPYYNLDPTLRYRQLGRLANRGIELSLTGQLAPGLTLVGGTLLLDPRLSGEAVASGQIGPRPVGQVRRRSVANLDWRLGGGHGALSFDLAAESLSRRIGNAANTLSAPARATFNLGARYRFKAAGGTFLLRPLVTNLTNVYGWNVSTSGGWTYTAPRAATIQLIADF